MLLTSFVPLLLAALPALGQDIKYDLAHNATPIFGTWSTGSKAVSTGPGFANPLNQTFIYPTNTGCSYSFDEDGHYEIARYRFNSNGSEPTCITGVMNWVHGTFDLLGNGSIVMTPFGDGYQQIQDPCGAVSNFIESYNDTELYQSWRIFLDPQDGPKLHLFQFDGTPVAPMFQLSATPNMLPTQALRNVTPAVQPALTSQKRSFEKRNAGERTWTPAGLVGLVVSLGTACAASLIL
ncbi:protein rot1 [Phanerochaete sordida]|uniref:Protein ROT1 n=1 Tax=Phanerochaete sordida TaxID=48140 RepID=A0A9P3GD99_9APHY|nr:protein rot1 [Phanerochaete sordida]